MCQFSERNEYIVNNTFTGLLLTVFLKDANLGTVFRNDALIYYM